LTEERLSKAAVVQAELEAEVSRGHSEVTGLQADLLRMKTASEALSHDKIQLNTIITQVRHFSLRSIGDVRHLNVSCVIYDSAKNLVICQFDDHCRLEAS